MLKTKDINVLDHYRQSKPDHLHIQPGSLCKPEGWWLGQAARGWCAMPICMHVSEGQGSFVVFKTVFTRPGSSTPTAVSFDKVMSLLDPFTPPTCLLTT